MSEASRQILIVNPNSNRMTTEMLLRAGNPSAQRFGLTLRGATAAQGPRMIIDPIALAQSAETTIATALDAVDGHPTRGIVIGAFGDPGLRRLRKLSGLPVVGIGASAIAAAAAQGKFAIATTTSELSSALDDLVAETAPEADYVGTFLTPGDPESLAATPDLMLEALERAVDSAVTSGARAVVIGGGPLSDSARRLAARTDVRIIEPMPSAIAAIAALLDSDRTAACGRPRS